MLLEAVVVAEDGAGADVRAFADVAVAEVREVVRLGPRRTRVFLVSTKLPMCASSSISLSGRRCENGPICAPSPTRLSVTTEYGFTVTRAPMTLSVTTLPTSTTDSGPTRVLPRRAHAGLDAGVLADLRGVVDAGVAEHARALAVQARADPREHQLLGLAQLLAIVHAEQRLGLAPESRHPALRRDQGDHVRQVVFALRVVG